MKLKLTSVPGPPPVGMVLVCSREDTIVAVDFTRERLLRLLGRRFGALELLPSGLYADEFLAYFRGALQALDALPIDAGGTAF